MRVPVREVYTSERFWGADPEMSQAEVYRMKIDEFDPSRNMAIFDIRNVRLESLHPTCQEIYSDFQILHETFLECPRAYEMPGWHDCVVVAGGAPLALLEAHLMTCREGNIHGRWKTCLETYLTRSGGERSSRSTFTDIMDMEKILTGDGQCGVKDIDVFVGGVYGDFDKDFRCFTDNFADKLTETCKERGLRVVSGDFRRNRYIERNRKVLLRDIAIGDRKIKLSFIQYGGLSPVESVVHRFDIDVCKVMFNPYTFKISADLKVVNAIVKGEASVCDFQLPYVGPNSLDVVQMCSTLQRMHKYSKRGFRFNRYPALMMLGYSGRTSPVLTWED